MRPEVVITLDTDWAPDFAIDSIADVLIDQQVKATWFVTHDSPVIRKLMATPSLFEVGLHPNLLPGSTQGPDLDAVMSHLRAIAPDASSVRMHALHQSTPILRRLSQAHGVTTDVSLFLPGCTDVTPHLLYLEEGSEPIVRIPYVWEDDCAMYSGARDWTISDAIPSGSGLKVLDFHPIHVYLNSRSMSGYESLKRQGNLQDVRQQAADRMKNTHSRGTGSLLQDIVAGVGNGGYSSSLIKEVRDRWVKGLTRQDRPAVSQHVDRTGRELGKPGRRARE